MVIKSTSDLNADALRELYKNFDLPVSSLDCGRKCAPYNPSGKPFCCDICHAVPAAYKSEWSYFQGRTNLWHLYKGTECKSDAYEKEKLKNETPKDMILLACLGPNRCQRDFRALSCRQFPFFPYVTSDYRFLGLAYEWEFEDNCWVVSNPSRVTQRYRVQFVDTYDRLFALFQDEFENYAYHSEKLREHYLNHGRRFGLLHRNGGAYLISPRDEQMTRIDADRLPKYGYYQN